MNNGELARAIERSEANARLLVVAFSIGVVLPPVGVSKAVAQAPRSTSGAEAQVSQAEEAFRVATGTTTEVNATGTDRMLFTRVYIKRGGRWGLLTSSQFRNPKLVASSSR